MMQSEHMIKLEMKDVLAAIEHLHANRSTDDNMDRLPSSPMHVLVYNQILQFSKEELEAPIQVRNRQVYLKDIVFPHRHGFFFSACIKKGAFHHLLSEESKWLLENIPHPTHQLMGAIHDLEKRNSKELNEPKTLTFPVFMDVLMGHYLYLLNTDEKKDVLDLILSKYAKKESQYLQKMVINEMPMYENYSATHEYIGRKLHELGLVTISLNSHLPTPSDYPDHKSDFNLNRYDISKINRLLKCGFRFDEENYNYYGDNLFIALVKSKNMNLCEVILPYLSNVTPKSGGYTEQHAIIESLAKTNPKDYKFIQSNYERIVLDLELEQKPVNSAKIRKPKIKKGSIMLSPGKIKFDLNDVAKALDKLDEVRSSSDNMEDLPRSPIHVLLYNQILSLSKEELEEPIKKNIWASSLADIVFKQRHAFFFSACIRQGAFHHLLSDETKFLLDNIDNPSNSLFESVHMIERSRFSKKEEQSEESIFPIFLNTLMSRYFYSFKDEEKKVVMDLIINKFAVKEAKTFADCVVKNMSNYSSTACDYIVDKLKELNIDLSITNLNCHLPKQKHNYKPFNIDKFERTKIEKLLKMGFRFDEKNYSYDGTNLFIAVARSEDFKLCEMILPYLSNITPANGDWDQQNKFIEYLPKIYPNNYRFIQSHYEKFLLSLELEQSPKSSEKIRKPKI